MPRSVLLAAIVSALVLAAPAAAHVVASPAFLASGSTVTVELSVPNERDAPMTSFVVTAPRGLEIVRAEPAEGWATAVAGRTATWTGGSLPAKLSETFGLRLEATAEPGSLDLDAEQRYADGNVRWPITLTIVPGAPASSDSGSSALVVGVIVAAGALVTAAIALLARRRRRSLDGST